MSRTPLYANRAKFWNLLLTTVFVASTTACAYGGDDGGAAVAVTDGSGAAMGSVAFPVSCGEEASAEMRLGLALLHNMTYPEAEAVFRRAAESRAILRVGLLGASDDLPSPPLAGQSHCGAVRSRLGAAAGGPQSGPTDAAGRGVRDCARGVLPGCEPAG